MSNENKQPDERATFDEHTIKQIGARFGSVYENRIVFYDDRFTEFAEALTEASRATLQATKCPACGGNDADMPCAFPRGGQPGCPRDARLGRNTQQATKGDERACTCNGVLGHSRSCALFDESMMRATTLSTVAGSAGQAPLAWARPDVAERLSSPIAYSVVTELLKKEKEGYVPIYTAPSLTTDAGAVLTRRQSRVINRAINYFVSTVHHVPAGIVSDLRALLAAHPTEQRSRDEVQRLREALAAINVIRNSIIGLQTLNWSEHVYPLVAALEAAGVEGMGYPEARKFFGTMLDRCNAAEDDAERYRWIRNGYVCIGRQSTLQMTGAALDDAVDAARKAEIERSGGEA